MQSASNATLYGQSWFLDAVAQQWDALVEDDYKSAMPLVWNRKWGIKSIYPPLMSQQLGVFAPKAISKELFDSYVKAVPDSFRKKRIRLNRANDFTPEGWIRSNWVNTVLDLNKPYEELRSLYSTNCKRNLKKAEQHGWHISHRWEPEASLELFKQGRGGGMEKEFYRSMKAIMSAAKQRDEAECWTLHDESDEIMASILIVHSAGRIYDLLQAVSAEGKQGRGSFLLVDAIIKKYAGKNLLLDFEGSMDEGVRRFYMGFGAREEPYWEIVRNRWPF